MSLSEFLYGPGCIFFSIKVSTTSSDPFCHCSKVEKPRSRKIVNSRHNVISSPKFSEAFIIYDESSSPSADDPALLLKLRRTGYIIDANYPIETYL
jgi:hypothetical protein